MIQPQYLQIIDDCVNAPVYLHTIMNVVHSDIKPDNILIDSDGRAVLTDFGISKHLGESTTVPGTPEYMAPELHRKESDPEQCRSRNPQC